MHKRISLIFLAGGKGLRMGLDTPKQFIPIKNKILALYSFEIFLSIKEISQIVVVCEKEFQHFFGSKTMFAPPGKRRQDSVYNGLQKLDQCTDLVLIHDSARPFIEKESVLNLINEGLNYKAAVLASSVASTIKECENNFVVKTLSRSRLFEIQTPQALEYNLLKQGFEYIQKNNLEVTDDVSIAEILGHKVKIVTGKPNNIKITTQHDLEIAKKLL
ncbi:MAG: 2-C-methyl-D-erythritol 4-phosphate cytidylyltransferase [Chlamydiae bacterium]|nr:2-C-methyl-D-erythritol 4-phosphate cytidylyltransferase [Chlamydiota bacterium]